MLKKVAPLLRTAGHEVYTPTLTGLGERVHLANDEVDLQMHIDDVVNLFRFEDLNKAILVVHSFGGTNPAVRAIPRTCISCVEGRSAEEIAAEEKKYTDLGWNYRFLPTGRDAMITMPDELSNILINIVS